MLTLCLMLSKTYIAYYAQNCICWYIGLVLYLLYMQENCVLGDNQLYNIIWNSKIVFLLAINHIAAVMVIIASYFIVCRPLLQVLCVKIKHVFMSCASQQQIFLVTHLLSLNVYSAHGKFGFHVHSIRVFCESYQVQSYSETLLKAQHLTNGHLTDEINYVLIHICTTLCVYTIL